MDNRTTTSTVFWRLLARVYGQPNGDAIVGDMREEFALREQSSPLTARLWIISQYTRTLSSGALRQCGTTIGLSRMMLLATIVVLPVLFGMVAWLSNMDETTPQLWEMVLAGEMHRTLFVGAYWQDQFYAIGRVDNLHMFINVNSAIWVIASMGLVILVGIQKPDAIRFATGLGVALMVVPYVVSLIYLDIAQLPPKKIGPIIAFTLFNIFYMLPMMAWWLRRQAARSTGANHA